MRSQKLLIAAVAGVLVGAGASRADEAKPAEVHCWGINGCGSHAKCTVGQDDLDAVSKLLGAKEYQKRFGKSEVHACGSHAKCGASQGILNWVPSAPAECKAKGGFVIEGAEGKKVARKA